MNDEEATEFCARCKMEVGTGFRDDWVELLIKVGGYPITMQAKNVELVEGRDYGKTQGLAKDSI